MAAEEDLAQALLRAFAGAGDIPTSGAGRLARTARATLGLGLRSAFGRRSAEDFLPLVTSLGELKGLAMKIGQILSFVDDTLPEEARKLLAVLQTHSPPMPFAQVEAVVRADVPAAAGDALLAAMDPAPVAAASIGQVHRAVMPDGRAVAVKVQYPAIAEAIRNDFAAAGRAIAVVKRFVPGVESYVDEAAERLAEECDYAAEAAHQRAFGEIYAFHPVLAVPGVHAAYSGRRVLTSDWHEGARFDAWLAAAPAQPERDRAGAALYEFYLGTLYRHGLFNADPHPGNYLFAPDGRVVALDYGCVRRYAPGEIEALVALRGAVAAADRRRVRAALEALGARPGTGADFDRAFALAAAFFGPTLEDGVTGIGVAANTEMRRMLADKRAVMRLQLPGKLLFLFRIKFGVHAVLARLGARARWSRLEEGWIASRGAP